MENKRFTFEEEGHNYMLDGKRMTGVTTILGVIAKPALIQWSATMACDFVRDNLTSLEDLDEILKEARVAHRKKKEASGDIGTAVHKACEDWIKNKTIPSLDEQGMKMFENFKNWAEENKVEFLESEIRVYSEKYWYAGTIDLVIKLNGHVYIGDIKTSSGIWDEHFYQTAGYQLALQELGLYPKIKGHIIINLKKDGKIDVKTSEDFAENKKAFLGALAIYRVQNRNAKNK